MFDKLAALHAKDPQRHPEPPARFNRHALRHFAISCWIETGLDPKTVQTFGHSSLAVTMDRLVTCLGPRAISVRWILLPKGTVG
jgi:hypothetical protein